MAVGEGSIEPDDDDKIPTGNGRPPATKADAAKDAKSEDEEDEEDEEDKEDDEEREEEPHLKYATLTKNLSSLYRNGDACSSVLVAGDKMIVGTHNGNIHVLALPTFQSLRVYHAHTASTSAISISPFPPPLPTLRLDAAQRLAAESKEARSPSPSPGPKNSPKQPSVPSTPSNQIYIATSSIDGHVCIASLVDPNDVQLRNFGRPVQAVAISPEYKSDKNYLSGGQAGSLILTTGGQAGKSANATTTGAAAAATGWLGTIGLGANTGTDRVLHSGEGIISTIKWSRTGRYVLWANEEGIKIMRSNLKLDIADGGLEWKRFGHIPRPDRPIWEEMSGVWKARAEWIDRENLETEENSPLAQSVPTPANGSRPDLTRTSTNRPKMEEVVVGWGDTVWIINVHPGGSAAGREGEKRAGTAQIAKTIRFPDCILSGVSLYTPNLLLVLAHNERKGDAAAPATNLTPRKGRQHRHNALKPDLQLIDINTDEEVDSDTLSITNFSSLSSSDYHLAILPPARVPGSMNQRWYLDAIGSGMRELGTGMGTLGSGLVTGVETVGQGVLDATLYAPRMLGANRLFTSSGDSIKSIRPETERTGSMRGVNYLTGWMPSFGSGQQSEELNDVATTQGRKIFIFSPYDCIVAVKRNLADRLQWLIQMRQYDEAWALVNEHPEAAGSISEPSEASTPPTPSKASSIARSGSGIVPAPAPSRQQATLAEFFADTESISSSNRPKDKNSIAEKEKRRIGELWLQQLVTAKKWTEAGEIAGKVLNTTSRWEHWIWVFLRNQKFDEIAPAVPTFQITPPLPSMIFEVILGHYVSVDRSRFMELLDQWPSDLFEIGSVTTAIEEQLKPDITPKETNDWRILQECLAKLYLGDGRYKDALRCYIRLQDADTAMSLIKEHHLVDAIADDVPGLVLLRVSTSQQHTLSNAELEELSSEPIKLLVDEATHGVVEPEEVVRQLQDASLTLYIFFYLRALWRGEGLKQKPSVPRVGRTAGVVSLAADEGKLLVEQFADTAVELFAEYDRDLLMDFLQTSTAYTFEKAVQICETRHYVEELVYLLSKTGQVKKALFLIIDELRDVSKAITFAKEQDDKDLWDDLLDYSMSRPRFISGLLAEVGTAIDPITLVKRIPSGLEIEGLRDGLKKMIREYDLQDSISRGVAKVLASEVAVGMDTLRRGRRRGLKFDIASAVKTKTHKPVEVANDGASKTTPQPGYCIACAKPLIDDDTDTETERETWVGFACGHVYHLSHLLHDPSQDPAPPSPPPEHEHDPDFEETTFTRTVGPKVTYARLLRDKIAAAGGCRACKERTVKNEAL